MTTLEEKLAQIDEDHARLERNYSPSILGWRMVRGGVDERVRWHKSLRNVLKDAEHERANSRLVVALWPQGAPVDRPGVVAVFHPAFPGYMQVAASLAATTGRVVHVAKERDMRWVYLFCHDPFAGCGDDDCYLRRQKDPSLPCEPCDQWFDTDFHYEIVPSGETTTISLS